MAIKKGLGKGLDALFLDNADNSDAESVINIAEIEPNRNQPRKKFDDEALTQLASSIREHGIIQPLIVRPLAVGGYQIVAGERRYRAAMLIGLKELPVIVREYDDLKTMEIALIENLQREDLNVIEEAMGYKELIDNYGMTQDDVSKSVGKSRSAVTNTLRLLNLPERVQNCVKAGNVSAGHARALLGAANDTVMNELADRIIREGLTVRNIEKMIRTNGGVSTAKKFTGIGGKQQYTGGERDSYFDEIEIALKTELNRHVKVVGTKGKGVVEIAFYSNEELGNIAYRLANKKKW